MTKKQTTKKKKLYFMKEEKKWTPIRGTVCLFFTTIWSIIPFLNIYLWKLFVTDGSKDHFWEGCFYDIVKTKVEIKEE